MINEAAFILLMSILPPCEYEDSTGCYWDAQNVGNRRGVSFVSDDLGRVLPVDPLMPSLCDTDAACDLLDMMLEGEL